MDGIKTFIRDHQCGDICRRLGLDKSITLGDRHGTGALVNNDEPVDGDEDNNSDED